MKLKTPHDTPTAFAQQRTVGAMMGAAGNILTTLLGWFGRAVRIFCLTLLVGWGGLVIYFSNLPYAPLRIVLAVCFALLSIWLLWLSRTRRSRLVFTVLFVGVVAWWISIAPSHDRPWRPEVAVMPRATIDGDRVRITGVRDFDYRSRDDFTIRYEEREIELSHLTGADFFVSYWSEGPVAHTFVSFTFDNAPPLSISIETRPEVGEGFDPLASLFKQFELIYVVGDERDLVRVRTNYRKERVYLYRLNSPVESVRKLLLIYLERINELADRPEFYHLLTNSCTINIIRYANAAGRKGGFDIRHLLNGLIDSYLYHSGRVNTNLPYEELRRRSLINEVAERADKAPDFSDRIRAAVPPAR